MAISEGGIMSALDFLLRGKILIDLVNVGGMDIKWNGPQIINNLVVNKQ